MTYRFPVLVGDRVAVAPHTDEWMQGLRFGDVTEVEPKPRLFGAARYTVTFASGTVRKFWAEDLLGAINNRPGKGA